MPDSHDLALRRMQTGIILELQRLRNATERRIAELLEQHELAPITPAQANALMVLVNAREPLTSAELARELGLSVVTVGRFVRALLEGDWVGRVQDPDDARRFLLSPTPKTRRSLPRFVAVSNTMLDEVFGDLSAGEIEALSVQMTALRGRLERGRDAAE